MKKRVPQGKKNEKQTGKASCFQLVEKRIAHFKDSKKLKTANNYACALKHFRDFRANKDLAIGDLSAGLMRDFQSYLTEKGLTMNTISLYNRSLRAVYNYALDEGILTTDKRPFRKVFTGPEKTRKRALDSEVAQDLVQLSFPNDEKTAFARDLFLFSLYMQGMPFVDIAHLTKKQLQGNHIAYQRRKTNQSLKVYVHALANAIIKRYRVKDPDCPYLFPILYDPKRKRTILYSSALRTYNRRLARVARLVGLDEPLTSYVSRHTWASLARQSGVADNVICEAMGHNNVSTTMIYLTSLDTGTVAAANRKVIATLTTPREPIRET